MNPGNYFYMPARSVHTYVVKFTLPVQALVFLYPAHYVLQYIDDTGVCINDGLNFSIARWFDEVWFINIELFFSVQIWVKFRSGSPCVTHSASALAVTVYQSYPFHFLAQAQLAF